MRKTFRLIVDRETIIGIRYRFLKKKYTHSKKTIFYLLRNFFFEGDTPEKTCFFCQLHNQSHFFPRGNIWRTRV